MPLLVYCYHDRGRVHSKRCVCVVHREGHEPVGSGMEYQTLNSSCYCKFYMYTILNFALVLFFCFFFFGMK